MTETVTDDPIASPARTREWLLERSKRDFVPIRRVFVQRPPGVVRREGPLAEFVRRRQKRALLAYLIISAGISAEREAGWSITLPSGAWARLMDTGLNAQPDSALTAVSKTLTWLEQRRLIARQRVGRSRQVRVTRLLEDGSGDPYTRPGTAGNRDPYIKLPHEFWLKDWSSRLSLPAIAMLLVASAEKPGFELPTERVPGWYGWSADTAEDGFRELRDAGLLRVERTRIEAPESHTGWAMVNRYTLVSPFVHRLQPPTPKSSKRKITKRVPAGRRSSSPKTVTTKKPGRASGGGA
ncbi:hypothetical protein [Micromonospora aurantiaca (nom. illeg.)]|uniref:hypothetical protein n=1 Tax=Micromonospora aurantiaca (nom. illeg.) TaxID=47850 RepID=UPI003F4A2CCC